MTTATRQRGSQGTAAGNGMAALEVEQPSEASPLRQQQAKQASAAAPGLLSVSQPLVLESSGAFKALLVAPLIVWWLAIGAGMWLYEGLPHGKKLQHGMSWFDRNLLRPAGPIVPFAVLLARAGVHAGAHWWQHCGRPAARRPALALGSLLLECLAVYSCMALARVAVYLTHVVLLSRRYLQFHVVSDHIFLAATMLICLHAEVFCLMSDMLRAARAAAAQGRVSVREVVLTLLLLVALCLYLFTAADMYYTAKYFHFPLESFSTTVIVFFAFQLPMLLWLNARRRLRG